jgi:hypothetical protein
LHDPIKLIYGVQVMSYGTYLEQLHMCSSNHLQRFLGVCRTASSRVPHKSFMIWGGWVPQKSLRAGAVQYCVRHPEPINTPQERRMQRRCDMVSVGSTVPSTHGADMIVLFVIYIVINLPSRVVMFVSVP